MKTQILWICIGLVLPCFTHAQQNSELNGNNRRYDSLLTAYHSERGDFKDMPFLARQVQKAGNNLLADTIARNYLDNYLINQSDQVIFERDNLSFVIQFDRNVSSRFFLIFLKNPGKIDGIFNRAGIAESYIDYVINRELIDSELGQHRNDKKYQPNWKKLEANLQKKYSRSVAERAVLQGQLNWYGSKADTSRLIILNMFKYQRYGLDTAGFGKAAFNNTMYELIFKHCNDRHLLQQAAAWMKEIVITEPGMAPAIDTYANLLHKLGDTKTALEWESKAAALAPADDGIKEAYNKMKRKEPTW